jgi:hypothetical protein
MILDEALLARLAEWRPAGPGPHQFAGALTAPAWTLSLTADQAESLGCRVTELSVRQAAARPADAAALTQWAVRCARRVTGLLEPLRVVEVDATRGEALLRSDQPAARGDELFYYELLLKGVHAATLHRYRATKAPGGRREAVPFALTHEAVAKLAHDLTAGE